MDWVSHYMGDIGTVVGAAWTCLSTFWAVRKHLECRRLKLRCQCQADYAEALAARAGAAKAKLNGGAKP